MNSQSIELLAPSYGIAWYPWAVQYFFLIAISYGALWIAVPGVMLGRTAWLPTARLALLAALSATLVAPVSLLADLHQPLRFWHFYAYPTPWSWMSLGSLFLPLYVALVVVLAWLVWREPMKAWGSAPGLAGVIARIAPLGEWTSPRWLVVLTAAAAVVTSLAVMLYTGAEVAVLKGRPLWHTEYLPAMFLFTGVIGAAGLVLVLNRFSGLCDSVVRAQMLIVILAAAVLAGLAAGGWFAQGLTLNEGSVAAALDSVRNNAEWRAIALWGAAAGVILFLGAGLMTLLRPLRHAGWVMGLLALHVAWMFRWTVFMDVQTVARNSAGFHEYSLPLGSQGLLGIVGTFGLWLAAVLVMNLFVPWQAALGGQVVAPDTRNLAGEPNYG
ncbi:tetrathionate reductase subunit C [Thalassospira sp. MBR-102]|jgi:tetrathionate reductase subunit C|uniref:NrfD/PsrC family molybdoenzyme membrane anchor subunit n=1 Tax=Thalassospira sp. MBR-102 TaxID=3156466 RepID=UPI0033986334